MQFQPKTAIICHDKVELDITLQMLEKADIRWCNGKKATDANWLYNKNCGVLIYINPPSEYRSYINLEWDRIDYDVRFEDWTYVEASVLLRNLLIAERKRNVT